MDYNNYNNGANVYQPMPPQEKKGLSIASMVLGICGFLAWCIPLFGYPVCIVGLILGIVGMKKGGKGMAIAGIVMSAITLVLTIANSALGAYLGATGQLF
ncbi:MAG: DUF4190 domain-containing protein [Lachnospiraceae bacterium]